MRVQLIFRKDTSIATISSNGDSFAIYNKQHKNQRLLIQKVKE